MAGKGGPIDPKDLQANIDAQAVTPDPETEPVGVIVAATSDIRSPRTRKPTNAVIASAARININDRAAVQTAKYRRQAWQTESWDYYDEIGELGYTVGFIANLMGKLRLYPAIKVELDGAPVPVDSEDSTFPQEWRQVAQDTLARLRSGEGGQSALIREASQNLEVAGEFYLHGHAEAPELTDEQLATTENAVGIDFDPNAVNPVTPLPDEVEEWQVRSVDELRVHGDEFVLHRGPGSKQGTPIPKGDLVIRMWERHPRYSEMATCAMRRLLAECETLLLLGRQLRSSTKSRLSNGVLLVPTELSFGGADITLDESDGEETVDPFDDELNESMITPIQEEGSAAAVVPLVMRGPSEHLAQVRKIDLGRVDDTELGAKIEQRILRIARGMNMPVEVTTGLMSTTFANAAQVKQSEFDDHIEPRAVLLCDAFTSGYFQWALELAGCPPAVAQTAFVWFDPEALIVKPDQSEQAAAAHEDGVISDEARRKYQGFTEDDAPSDAEKLLRVLLRSSRLDPTIQGQLLITMGLAPASLQVPAPQSGVLGDDEAASVAPAPGVEPGQPLPVVSPLPGGPNDDPPTPVSASAVAAAEQIAAWLKLGPALTAVDRDLRTRIQGALDQAMKATLDRAGNRVKAATQRVKSGKMHPMRAALESKPAREVAATLGPEGVEAAGLTGEQLIAHAFDTVLEDVAVWMLTAHQAAQDKVSKVTDVDWSQADVETARNVEAARQWLLENLTALAGARLYSPNPAAPTAGEADPTVLVPASLVRAAMAMAGGTTPKGGSMIAGAWVDSGVGGAVTDLSGAPVGGIATGGSIMGAIAGVGGQVRGWLWEYGGAVRTPFPPHEALSGTTVGAMNDPSWSNTDSFPPFGAYFPGDHDGCTCDIVPILSGPDDVISTETPEAYQAAVDAETDGSIEGPDGYMMSTRSAGDFADEQGWGVGGGEPSEDDIKSAKAQLGSVRAEVRETADQLARDHEQYMDSFNVGRGQIVRPAPTDSWFQGLAKDERVRLVQNGWFAPRGETTGMGADEVADKVRAGFGFLEGVETQQTDPMAVWVQETRMVDVARSLANARAVIPSRYGGLEANDVVRSEFDMVQLFANKQEAAEHVAQVWNTAGHDDAFQTLGHAVGGPAPYEMTEAEYITEVTQVDRLVQSAVPVSDDEWGVEYSAADKVAIARLDTLIPPAVDPDGQLGFDEIYANVVKLAREAGLV